MSSGLSGEGQGKIEAPKHSGQEKVTGKKTSSGPWATLARAAERLIPKRLAAKAKRAAGVGASGIQELAEKPLEPEIKPLRERTMLSIGGERVSLSSLLESAVAEGSSSYTGSIPVRNPDGTMIDASIYITPHAVSIGIANGPTLLANIDSIFDPGTLMFTLKLKDSTTGDYFLPRQEDADHGGVEQFPSGSDFFRASYALLSGEDGKNITQIKGSWVNRPDVRDNYDAFKEAYGNLLKGGYSRQDAINIAAASTWTGKMAASLGYTEIVDNTDWSQATDPRDVGEHIEVFFRKPTEQGIQQ